MTSNPIIVVSDVPEMRVLFAQALSLEGYRVMALAGVEQAVYFAHRAHPNLIIADVKEIGGNAIWDRQVVSMCWRLRTNPVTEEIPLLLVGAVPHLHVAPLIPAFAILEAPFDLADLYGLVEQGVTRRKGALRTPQLVPTQSGALKREQPRLRPWRHTNAILTPAPPITTGD